MPRRSSFGPPETFSLSFFPPLSTDSWPFPGHWVCRGVLFLSAQSRRPWSHPSTCLPQLRRLHHRGEEQRRPQPFVSPWSDTPLVRSWSHGPDRGYRFAHARPAPLARPSAPMFPSAGPAWAVRPPPMSLTPLARLSALARPRACALGRRSNLSRRFLI
jgi:hypothetical protein